MPPFPQGHRTWDWTGWSLQRLGQDSDACFAILSLLWGSRSQKDGAGHSLGLCTSQRLQGLICLFQEEEGKMVLKAKELLGEWQFTLYFPSGEGDRLGLDRHLLQAPVGQWPFGN